MGNRMALLARRLLPQARPLLIAAALAVVVFGQPTRSAAQGEPVVPGPVYIIDISGGIDLGLAPYLGRVLDDAAEDNASLVVVRIDTPGGRLDAVLQMRDFLIDSSVPTAAFVDSTAFSAGALIALACEQIYMTPGAVMGAATPVSGSGDVADEKTISAVRSTFESTAELRGRDPRIAAAMVDPEVDVDGVSERGRLLTLTASQAVDAGYADGLFATRAALLDELGLGGVEQVETSPGLAERLVRILTNPVLASLLLTVGLLALIADLASGGIGIGVAIGIGLLGVFFWGHMLAGLAGWEDAALVTLGLVLIAVEVFVFPGFGIAGVLGAAALLAGAFLAMIYRDFDVVSNDDLVRAALSVSVAFLLVVVATGVLLSALSRGGARSGLVLQDRLGVAAPLSNPSRRGRLRLVRRGPGVPRDGVARDQRAPSTAGGPPPAHPDPRRPLVGAIGTALTDLRPSGIAEIEGHRVDVVSSGEFLPRGETIEVVSDEGYRRVVRRRSR